MGTDATAQDKETGKVITGKAVWNVQYMVSKGAAAQAMKHDGDISEKLKNCVEETLKAQRPTGAAFTVDENQSHAAIIKNRLTNEVSPHGYQIVNVVFQGMTRDGE